MAKFRLPQKWITLLITALAGAFFLTTGGQETSLGWVVAICLVACLAAEALWHPALDGSTPVSVAAAAHLIAIAVLPGFWGVPLTMFAALLGTLLWRRKGFPSALGNAAVTGAAALAAWAVFTWTGVLDGGGGRMSPLVYVREPLRFPLFFLAGISYLVVFQGLISMRTARTRGVSVVRAWRSVFGKSTELIMSGALVTVSTLGFLCFLALGSRGLLLCVMPLIFIRDGSRRNIELESAQTKLIKNERLAAKGEMAAEIGHELNNFLAAISGRAQLVLRKIDSREESSVASEAKKIQETATRMGELAKGLMDFSRREVRSTTFGLNELVEKTVEFVRPQAKFRIWEFVLSADPKIPRVEVDPGQIQQVLITLLGRIVQTRPTGTEPCGVEIRTFNDIPRRSAGIEIRSSLRGTTAASDPEHGEAALDTVERILERHHGRFEHEETETGETYRVLLPAA